MRALGRRRSPRRTAKTSTSTADHQEGHDDQRHPEVAVGRGRRGGSVGAAGDPLELCSGSGLGPGARGDSCPRSRRLRARVERPRQRTALSFADREVGEPRHAGQPPDERRGVVEERRIDVVVAADQEAVVERARRLGHVRQLGDARSARRSARARRPRAITIEPCGARPRSRRAGRGAADLARLARVDLGRESRRRSAAGSRRCRRARAASRPARCLTSAARRSPSAPEPESCTLPCESRSPRRPRSASRPSRVVHALGDGDQAAPCCL